MSLGRSQGENVTKDINARVTMGGTHTGYLLLMGERWSEAQHTCQPRLHEQAAGHTEMENVLARSSVTSSVGWQQHLKQARQTRAKGKGLRCT